MFSHFLPAQSQFTSFVVKELPLLKTEHCLSSSKRGRKGMEIKTANSMAQHPWNVTHWITLCRFVNDISTTGQNCQVSILWSTWPLLSCFLMLAKRKWQTWTRHRHKQRSRLWNVAVLCYQEYFEKQLQNLERHLPVTLPPKPLIKNSHRL